MSKERQEWIDHLAPEWTPALAAVRRIAAFTCKRRLLVAHPT